MPKSERDELLERVVAELRRPVPLRSDFDARVMAAVRQPVPGPGRRLVSWLVTPRSVRLSPLAGFALAAAVVLLVFAVAIRPSRGAPATMAAGALNPPPAGSRLVQFVLVAPAADRVALVGDFNDWQSDATPLVAAPSGGVWTVMVPLAPGQHQYAFVVNGSEWLADPQAPRETGDDFGRPSSLVTVAGKGRL